MALIETERLIIEIESPATDSDSLMHLLENPENRPFHEPTINLDIEKVRSILGSHQQSFTTNPEVIKSGKGGCYFSIRRKSDAMYLGNSSVSLCRQFNEVEISFTIVKEFWGKGYGLEAAKATLLFGFEQANILAIYAAVNPGNIASERILKHLGMVLIKKIEWPRQGLVNLYKIERDGYLKYKSMTEEKAM